MMVAVPRCLRADARLPPFLLPALGRSGLPVPFSATSLRSLPCAPKAGWEARPVLEGCREGEALFCKVNWVTLAVG